MHGTRGRILVITYYGVSITIPETQEERAPRKRRYRKRYPAVGSVGSIRNLGNLMRIGRIAFAKLPKFFNLTKKG